MQLLLEARHKAFAYEGKGSHRWRSPELADEYAKIFHSVETRPIYGRLLGKWTMFGCNHVLQLPDGRWDLWFTPSLDPLHGVSGEAFSKTIGGVA